MEYQVLVLTGSDKLIKQINHTVKSVPELRAILTTSTNEILELVGKTNFEVLLLDTGVKDVLFRDLHDVLTPLIPGLRWLVLPPEDEDEFLPLLGFLPDGYLSRPFDQDELLEQLQDLYISPFQETEELAFQPLFVVPPPDPDSSSGSAHQAAIILNAPRQIAPSATRVQSRALVQLGQWLANADEIDQLMVSLIEITGAQAVMVTRKDQLMGYSSKLPARAKPELIRWLYQSGVTEALEEIVSFLSMESTGQEHLISVTPLDSEVILILMYEAGVSFKDVRSRFTKFMNEMTKDEVKITTSDAKSRELDIISSPTFSQEEGKRDAAGQQVFQDYTVLMIPRSTEDRLIDKISSSLVEWIHQISLIHNWRFDNLLIQPDYVLWTTRLSSSSELEKQVRVFRHYTSIRLHSYFPSLAAGDVGPDFWDPTHLQTTSGIPLQQKVIRTLIEKIRNLD